MIYVYWAIDLLSKALEGLIISHFFNATSNNKKSDYRPKVMVCLAYIIFSLFLKIFGISSFWFNIVLGLSFNFLFSVAYELTMQRRLIYSVIFLILAVLSEVLVSLALSIITTETVEVHTGEIAFYFLGSICSKFMLLLLIKPLQMCLVFTEIKIPKMFVLFLMTFPASSALVLFSVWDLVLKMESGIYLFSGAVTALIVANIAVFYMFESYLLQLDKQTKLQRVNQQMEYQAQHFRELAEERCLSNRTLHDLKNGLFAVMDMMKENPPKALEMMKILSQAVSTSQSSGLVTTNNNTLDALLASKYKRMKKEGIQFHFKCFMSPENYIDNIDFCVLLGNLVDNAIEACEKISHGDKSVNLQIAQSGDYLSVRISNTVDEIVNEVDGYIATTKDDKENHGFGIKSIQTIAQRYNGHCTFEQQGNVFTVIVSLKNSE